MLSCVGRDMVKVQFRKKEPLAEPSRSWLRWRRIEP